MVEPSFHPGSYGYRPKNIFLHLAFEEWIRKTHLDAKLLLLMSIPTYSIVGPLPFGGGFSTTDGRAHVLGSQITAGNGAYS